MQLMQPSEYVSEFILTRVHQKSFVLVEGTTDRALWTEYAADDCHLRPAQGKDIILDVLKTPFLLGIPGIAGIVDLDYWLITDADELATENLLYDDCCPDMELILLSSPALKKVLRNELYSFEIEKIHELADKLTCEALRLATEYGYFRLLNHLNDYGIRFRDFDLSEVIDPNTLQLNRQKTAKRLTQQKACISSEDLLRQVDDLREMYPPDNIQLCRGKDVISIMAIILPIIFHAHFGEEMPRDARSAFREKALSIRLRSAYDSAYFNGTSLFDSIRSWESANNPYKILKPDI